MKPTSAPARVMLAMDEDGAASMVQHLLIVRGHRVELASHVQDIIDAINAGDLDVAILDNDWVARLGASGLRDLQDLSGRHIRFIYLSSHLTGQVGVTPRPGRDVVLNSPFSVRQLATAIETRNGRRRYQPNIQLRGLPA